MSQYLHIVDIESGEELLELGMRTVHALVEICGEEAPEIFTDHDLFGFDHSPYYDSDKDGEHSFFPSRGDVLADLDRLITNLKAAQRNNPIGAFLPAQHLKIFLELRAKIERSPNAQVTSYVWF